jgi:hypothetical protein
MTCPFKARIMEPEKMAAARQQLCKHVYTETKSRDHRNGYTRNNRGTVGRGVFYAILAEIM